MSYTPTVYVDGQAPDLSAANLNHNENGLQAAAAVADAALPVPAALAAGDFPVWSGSAWVKASSLTTQRINAYGTTVPKITTSTLAGGPPASPQDGDIWIATAVDANGTRWAFQYNAGSASAFKWEFIGGFPQAVSPVGSITTASATPVDLTGGPTLTLARAGDYMVELGDNSTSQAAGINNMVTLLNVAGVNQSQTNGLNFVATAQFQGGQQSTETIITGVAAGTVLKLQVESQNSLSTTFLGGWIKATPRRIS
jgi:hypothetical protein